VVEDVAWGGTLKRCVDVAFCGTCTITFDLITGLVAAEGACFVTLIGLDAPFDKSPFDKSCFELELCMYLIGRTFDCVVSLLPGCIFKSPLEDGTTPFVL